MASRLRNWKFSRFGASQPFRSYEMGAPVLRSGTCVLKLVSQLRKFSQRGACGCELVSQQSADFAEAAKSRRPLVFALFLLCFCYVFAPFDSERLPFNFFAFPLDFDHLKTYITSKQLELKH